MPDKKPRKVRKDKGVKRGLLKDQRFMKEMEPLFGPFDPKKLEQDKFMKDMSDLFIVHKTTEQLQKEEVEAGIKYNQSLPPNERVMFNMDLLRHINKFVSTPLKDAVAYAKEHKDTTYEYFEPGMTESKTIDFYEAILQIIVSLKDKQEKIPIFGGFTVVKYQSYYDDVNQDVFDSIYNFLELLKIHKLFEFGTWYYKELDEAERIFGTVDEEVEHALEWFNDNLDDDEEILTEDDFHTAVPMIQIDDLTDARRQAGLERLEAVVKQLNLKDKPKRK